MHTALPQQLAGSFQDAELSSLVHIWGVLHFSNHYFFQPGLSGVYQSGTFYHPNNSLKLEAVCFALCLQPQVKMLICSFQKTDAMRHLPHFQKQIEKVRCAEEPEGRTHAFC